MPSYRACLIGTGNIAGTYVSACQKLDALSIHSVLSRDLERAQAFAAQHGIAQACTSLADADADLVLIANPSGCHADAIVAAAAAGMHALVEKPLDITAEAMARAHAAAQAADRLLGVCYQRRTRSENQAVKQLLDAGALGRVLAVDLNLKFYRGDDYYQSAAWRGTKAIDGGGPFIQQACHDIDLLCWLFGRPSRALGRVATLGHTGIEVEDHGGAILDLPGGGLVTVVASTIARPGFSPRMDVITDRGSFTMVNDEVTMWAIDGVEQPQGAQVAARHDAATSAAVSDTSGHEAIISDFLQAITDKRQPMVDAVSAAMSVDTILAIYQSAESGQAVEISASI